jgi:hypothetical protein
MYDVKFLALLAAPYIYDIIRLRVKERPKYVRQKYYVNRDINKKTCTLCWLLYNFVSKCMVLTT